MSKQQLIAIGRESGSGGYEIARQLAKRLNLPLYDKNLLEKIAEEKNGDADLLRKFDEKPKIIGVHRVVDGLSNAPGDQIAQMQFDYLLSRAREGESFVVLGRCADEILQGFPGLVSAFILADEPFKLARIMAQNNVSQREALALMAKTDRQRRTYHNQRCKGQWGEAKTYDLTINSARLGIEGTVELLENYIHARAAQDPS